MVNEEISFFIEELQLIKAGRIIQLGHSHFAIPNDLMDVSSDHHWLIKP